MAELKRAKVKLLVDTRAVAASRKPGFSKRQLAAGSTKPASPTAPAKARHADGGPRSGARRQARQLWRIYDRHLETPEAQRGDGRVDLDREVGPAVCLLCYERDKDCHRTRIAEICERTGARVDLVPPLF